MREINARICEIFFGVLQHETTWKIDRAKSQEQIFCPSFCKWRRLTFKTSQGRTDVPLWKDWICIEILQGKFLFSSGFVRCFWHCMFLLTNTRKNERQDTRIILKLKGDTSNGSFFCGPSNPVLSYPAIAGTLVQSQFIHSSKWPWLAWCEWQATP